MARQTFTGTQVAIFISQCQSGVELATEQAEAIQHGTIRHIVDDAEVFVAGQRVQAVYDWNGDGKWSLSESYAKTYVYDAWVSEIEREIHSGLFYLTEPEETAFKLSCGLIVEYDRFDAAPYVLRGHQGGEIDRWDEVRDLAECTVDWLMEEKEAERGG